MTANEYVKSRFGRFMEECTYEEIYTALLEYVKEKTKERESKKNKETKKDKSGSETSSNDKNQSASTEPIISATEERKEDRP